MTNDTSWKVTLKSVRVNAGEYRINDRYFVVRRKSAGMYEVGTSWYWRDGQDGTTSGYFDTKAQAMADLDHHVNVVSGREAFARAKGWA